MGSPNDRPSSVATPAKTIPLTRRGAGHAVRTPSAIARIALAFNNGEPP
jgi:hypothetical protein